MGKGINICNGNNYTDECIGHIVIPETYNGLPVQEIASRGFIDSTITSVFIPGSIFNIGAYAFDNCNQLKDVTIANGVEEISELSFNACNSIESIVFPESITYINHYCLYRLSGLKNVILKCNKYSVRSLCNGSTLIETIYDNAILQNPNLEKIYAIEGHGWNPGDTICGLPVHILPANGGATIAKKMTVKEIKI